MELFTKRLRLLPLTLEQLQLLHQHRYLLEESLGLSPAPLQMIPDMRVEFQEAIHDWIEQVATHPEDYPWHTNWEIILLEENRSVGGISLTYDPLLHPERVITGYIVDQAYQQRGIATESLRKLLQWIFSHEHIQTVAARTPHDNTASQRVLRKNYFRLMDQGDESLLWELDRRHWRRRSRLPVVRFKPTRKSLRTQTSHPLQSS